MLLGPCTSIPGTVTTLCSRAIVQAFAGEGGEGKRSTYPMTRSICLVESFLAVDALQCLLETQKFAHLVPAPGSLSTCLSLALRSFQAPDQPAMPFTTSQEPQATSTSTQS